jgi:hypothetical protein
MLQFLPGKTCQYWKAGVGRQESEDKTETVLGFGRPLRTTGVPGNAKLEWMAKTSAIFRAKSRAKWRARSPQPESFKIRRFFVILRVVMWAALLTADSRIAYSLRHGLPKRVVLDHATGAVRMENIPWKPKDYAATASWVAIHFVVFLFLKDVHKVGPDANLEAAQRSGHPNE